MKYVVSIVVMIVLAGCNTIPGARSSREFSLQGVVYTGSGAPLRDARITLDAQATVWSDANGRFTIPRVEPGEHRVRAEHDAHETVDLTMTVSFPTDVLYLRLLSAEDLARASQRALDRGAPSRAEELIARALSVGPNSARARYLAAIVYTDSGRFEDARRMLDHPGLDPASPAIELLIERLSEEDPR